ncbi:Ca-activated chloride channel family protein [Haloferula luteola]|uniref:Ca-activated chloride channel family protein n=1 Tax=Haloferula luteola TaxID=595692 RepID=A0A840V660_9BACT|nr:VWA domain-containing protein [Haloferula luteola]MBB5353747.1 Ca-activated chloride channel family protein [Haloferula luteola]
MRTTVRYAGMMAGILGAWMGSVRAAEGATKMILVLDASGSMWGRIEGRSKIEIAREAVAKLVDQLPDETELGLVAYGHREKGKCDDIELLVEPTLLDREAFKETVRAVQPKGMTPLTAAVVFAAEALRSTEGKATVILVTDGEETCDQDPCEAAQILEETGVDFTAHVVAFDLDDRAAKSVECLAKSTGGMFLKAGNATTLADALEMLTEPARELSPMEEPGEASVVGPETVIAGSELEVRWTGPDEPGDYLTLVPKDLEDGAYRNYEYTRGGSPLTLLSIVDEGPAELRYVHARTGKVLARAAVEVVASEISLKAVPSVVAGASVEITWSGPDHPGDYLTIVAADAEDGSEGHYQYTSQGSPAKVVAPLNEGDAEIRYQTENGHKVLARIPLKVTKAEVTLQAVDQAVAGSAVEIHWTGPNHAGDYVTIVPKGTEEGAYGKYAYTELGNPLKVPAPMEAGEAEIRYQTEEGGKVLARIPLRVEAAKVTLSAPATVTAGTEVSIEWTGPDNEGDYLTLVPKNLEDGAYAEYAYTKDGKTLTLRAPAEAGEGEIRYQSEQGGGVIARIPIQIVPAE